MCFPFVRFTQTAFKKKYIKYVCYFSHNTHLHNKKRYQKLLKLKKKLQGRYK